MDGVARVLAGAEKIREAGVDTILEFRDRLQDQTLNQAKGRGERTALLPFTLLTALLAAADVFLTSLPVLRYQESSQRDRQKHFRIE